MAWDLTSILVGTIAGFVVGALVFTQTGREVSGHVARAGSRRVAYHIEPRKRRG